jgi:glutaconate CoA-transferase subunit B
MSAEFTLEELLIARMSREFSGENLGIGAGILSDLAARLAKVLYAPDLFLTTASRAAADCDVHPKSMLDEWVISQSAGMGLGWQEMFDLIAQGRLQIWIGAVQIDRAGSSNISVVGPWEKPKVQLIGARGVPDDLWGCERLCYHMRKQTKRSFVEKVDFVCGLGYGPERLRVGGGPALPGLVVSDLGVFDFDEQAGEMRIHSLHPGVTFDLVQSRTGFAWPEPKGAIPVTEAPTAEELHVIREVIDPRGLRRLESDAADGALQAQLWQDGLKHLGLENAA